MRSWSPMRNSLLNFGGRSAISYQLRAGHRCAYDGILELDPSNEVKEKVSHNSISGLVRVLRPEERGTVVRGLCRRVSSSSQVQALPRSDQLRHRHVWVTRAECPSEVSHVLSRYTVDSHGSHTPKICGRQRRGRSP